VQLQGEIDMARKMQTCKVKEMSSNNDILIECKNENIARNLTRRLNTRFEKGNEGWEAYKIYNKSKVIVSPKTDVYKVGRILQDEFNVGVE
jgi:hypothetical protein